MIEAKRRYALDKDCRKLGNEVGRGQSCEWRWITESCHSSNGLTCMYRVGTDQVEGDRSLSFDITEKKSRDLAARKTLQMRLRGDLLGGPFACPTSNHESPTWKQRCPLSLDKVGKEERDQSEFPTVLYRSNLKSENRQVSRRSSYCDGKPTAQIHRHDIK
jgi:hypothetical protein